MLCCSSSRQPGEYTSEADRAVHFLWRNETFIVRLCAVKVSFLLLLCQKQKEKTMLIPVLLFIVGLLCLIKGGDWFVDGATGIARPPFMDYVNTFVITN